MPIHNKYNKKFSRPQCDVCYHKRTNYLTCDNCDKKICTKCIKDDSLIVKTDYDVRYNWFYFTCKYCFRNSKWYKDRSNDHNY